MSSPLFRTCLLSLTALAVSQHASTHPQVWSKQVGTSGDDAIYDVVSDGAGGSFEVGESSGPLGGIPMGDLDAYIGRRDGAGNALWQRKLGTLGEDSMAAVVSDGQGGVLVAGSSEGNLGGTNQGFLDIFIARYDGAGNLQWIVSHGGAGLDEPTAASPDGAGGMYVTGVTSSSLAGPHKGSFDAWVGRFDSSGGLMWWRQVGSTLADESWFANSDGVGGVIVGGRTQGAINGFSYGAADAWYARFDAAGAPHWIRQFGSTGSEILRDGISDGAGGVYLAGNSTGTLPGTNGHGAFVLHVDAQHNVLWGSAHGGISDSANQLELDGMGSLLVGGGRYVEVQSSLSNLQPYVGRFDSVGNPIYEQSFGGSANDGLFAMSWDGSGGLVVAGTSYSWVFGVTSDAWIARFESCDFDAFSTYCPSLVNSTGAAAAIGQWGSPYVSNNDLTLTVTHCPTDQLGVFAMGSAQNALPFGNGILCLGGSVHRLFPPLFTSDIGGGQVPIDLDNSTSPASLITPGSTWNFQFWYRDVAAGGAGFNLSNGLSATFCP